MRTPFLRYTLLGAAIGAGLSPAVQAADWNGSYIADGQCYCVGVIDSSIRNRMVPTPVGGQSVEQICNRIGSGPGLTQTDGMFDKPVYADPQCGNGPFPSNAKYDPSCSGAYEPGVDCQPTGPSWSLETAYSESAPALLETATEVVTESVAETTAAVTGASRYIDPSKFRADDANQLETTVATDAQIVSAGTGEEIYSTIDEAPREQVILIDGVEVAIIESESERQTRIVAARIAAEQQAAREKTLRDEALIAQQQRELELARQRLNKQPSEQSGAAVVAPIAQTEASELAEQNRIKALAKQARANADAKLAAQKSPDATTEQARINSDAQAAQQARIDATALLADQQRADAEAKLAEQARVDAEAKLAEQARADAEAKLAEQARVDAEAKLAEQARADADAKLAEQARVDVEAKPAEQARADAEAKLAEQARVDAEAKLAAKQAADKAAKESAQAVAEESTRDAGNIAPIAALQLPAGVDSNYSDYKYVQALPIGYDAGGGGLAVSGSYASHGKWHYVGRAGVADSYKEVLIGAGYYLIPPGATRMSVSAMAGVEHGEFELRSGDIRTRDSDSGLTLNLTSRFVLTRQVELQAGVGYSSFFDGDVHFLGGGFVHLNKQLDLTSQFELGDNNSFGLGIRYYY